MNNNCGSSVPYSYYSAVVYTHVFTDYIGY